MKIRSLLAAATVLALVPTSVNAAPPPCPIAPNELVVQALHTPVTGGAMADPFDETKAFDNGPDLTVCMWDTDTGNMVMVVRQLNAFADGSTPTDMAIRQSRLPAEARAEVAALREAGVTDLQLPTYQISPASGFGNGAVWVFQNEATLAIPSGSIFIQRGVDALVFGIVGQEEPLALSEATALANTILPTLP